MTLLGIVCIKHMLFGQLSYNKCLFKFEPKRAKETEENIIKITAFLLLLLGAVYFGKHGGIGRTKVTIFFTILSSKYTMPSQPCYL